MRLADLVVAGMLALLKKYGNKITAHQRRALQAIINCRTGAFGSTLMSSCGASPCKCYRKVCAECAVSFT